MSFFRGLTITAATLLLFSATAPVRGQDASRPATGGGISVPGWMGAVDAAEKSEGQTINDVKLSKAGNVLQVVTGPAASFWNPANKATGDYTVSATFTEAKYMNLNDHPHPYGIFIAGNDLGTDHERQLYCEAYGDGRFIVRGFGPDSFKMNGHGEANAAVHKAAGPGQPVEQTVALSVKGGKVECAINGTVVASYDKSQVVTAGKLNSTDGIYGIRFSHNTEGSVSGLKMTRP
jgi:hypothetical protein